MQDLRTQNKPTSLSACFPTHALFGRKEGTQHHLLPVDMEELMTSTFGAAEAGLLPAHVVGQGWVHV